MANLDDLGYTSILDMANDEAIDLLRQIRLSRRIPEKRTKKTTSRTKVTTAIDVNMANELLRLLEGK